MSLKSVVWRLLIYKENSTNCYFSIYLLGWETLVNKCIKQIYCDMRKQITLLCMMVFQSLLYMTAQSFRKDIDEKPELSASNGGVLILFLQESIRHLQLVMSQSISLAMDDMNHVIFYQNRTILERYRCLNELFLQAYSVKR